MRIFVRRVGRRTTTTTTVRFGESPNEKKKNYLPPEQKKKTFTFSGVVDIFGMSAPLLDDPSSFGRLPLLFFLQFLGRFLPQQQLFTTENNKTWFVWGNVHRVFRSARTRNASVGTMIVQKKYSSEFGSEKKRENRLKSFDDRDVYLAKPVLRHSYCFEFSFATGERREFANTKNSDDFIERLTSLGKKNDFLLIFF